MSTKKQQNGVNGGDKPPSKEVSKNPTLDSPLPPIIVPTQVFMLLEQPQRVSNGTPKQAVKERTIAAADAPAMLKAVAWTVKEDEKEAKRWKTFLESPAFSHVKHLLLICQSAEPEAIEIVESHLKKIRKRHRTSIETCAYYDHGLQSACIDVFDSYKSGTDSFNTMFALLDLLVWRRNPRKDESLKKWKEVKEGEEVEITTYSKQVKPFVKTPFIFRPAGFFQVHVQAANGTQQNHSLYGELLKYLGTKGRDAAVKAEKRENRDLFLCYEDVRLTITYPEEGQQALDELNTLLPLIHDKVPEAVCVNIRILTGHDTFFPEEEAIYDMLQGCEKGCKTAIAALCNSSRPSAQRLIDLKYYQRQKKDGGREIIRATMIAERVNKIGIQVMSKVTQSRPDIARLDPDVDCRFEAEHSQDNEGIVIAARLSEELVAMESDIEMH